MIRYFFWVFRYNLLKILQRFGEIKNFELIFHKSGVKEGEPRGFCFVEFKTREVSAPSLLSTSKYMYEMLHILLKKKSQAYWSAAEIKPMYPYDPCMPPSYPRSNHNVCHSHVKPPI